MSARLRAKCVELPCLQMDVSVLGNVTIKSFKQIDRSTYELQLVADRIAPLVWLQLTADVLGWFSDNAFTMTHPTVTLTLHVEYNPQMRSLTVQDIKVCSFRDCGSANAHSMV
ncbi:putative beta-mannosidase [Toxocara canis]|uniref:Putative beta-mannosidase n=1 Tax=Toxocara canis TaxID=6265 RepID=A0A0B2UQJ4_TOXCA|nr:putative beta-mannosidase [Toxocara canis]